METPVAVLAGTPVDTQMGASFVMQAGLTACPFPLAADPRSQTAFQISSQEEKLQAVRDVLAQAQSQGCRRVFVYCNSLSSSVDFPTLACETGLRIVTPLWMSTGIWRPPIAVWGSSPPMLRGWQASSGRCLPPIPSWICWEPACFPQFCPLRPGFRPGSWWHSIIWGNWPSGTAPAAWKL